MRCEVYHVRVAMFHLQRLMLVNASFKSTQQCSNSSLATARHLRPQSRCDSYSSHTEQVIKVGRARAIILSLFEYSDDAHLQFEQEFKKMLPQLQRDHEVPFSICF